MTITVLLMSILTGQNHTVVAEYDTPQACEAAAQTHQKVLLGISERSIAVLLKRAHANERSADTCAATDTAGFRSCGRGHS